MGNGDESRAASDEGMLRLDWKPEQQTFAFGDDLYVHEGPTKTNPSHDLAHLLIAANGGLPWHPSEQSWRFAEYNAVFLETLLNQIRYSVVTRPLDGGLVLRNTLRHARWFVEKHYAPFPTPAEEAYRLFCREIDPEVITQLSPLYFDLRTVEISPQGAKDGVSIRMPAAQTPLAIGKAAEFATQVGAILERIAGRRAGFGDH